MVSKNFFVAYDLVAPGQNYEAVRDAVWASCNWYMKLQYSLYYISSDLTDAEIYERVRRAQDKNDKLAVIAASNAVISTESSRQQQDFLQVWHNGTVKAA